ncbi:MAG: anti-sigma factor antagonist [Christensenellales bacterium]|nr:anti-sigma factor antagonist [Christensenellales bacterium]
MVKSKRNGRRMIVYLSGELDHCASERLRAEIESLLADTQIVHLVFDFEQVSFMDSSGVGMMIGRYKTMRTRGGTVSARRLNPTVEKLFRMAGLHRIMTLEDTGRQEEA